MRFLTLLAAGISASWAASAAAPPPSPAKMLQSAPIRFEQNVGQAQEPAQWTARGLGYAFLFTPDATVLRLGNRAVYLKFEGSNPTARFQASEKAPGWNTYFTAGFRGTVGGFRKLRRASVYPGIDVVYYGNGQQLEYDFEVAAGADPSRIALKFDGTDSVHLNAQGDLVLQLGSGEVMQRLPVVYQKRASGETVAVHSSYRIGKDGLVRLSLGTYRKNEKLVIDPTILYTTFLNGNGTDATTAIAHDAQGYIYLAGNTNSTNFPLEGTPYQLFDNGAQDAMFVKLDPTPPGSDAQVIYGTYLGGTGQETLLGMAVDPASGVVYLTGLTASLDFPTTASAYNNGSTVTAESHMFLSVIDPNQGTNGLLYSTYFAGSNIEEGDGIALQGGKVYVVGTTNSTDLPTGGPASAAYQQAATGDADLFIAEFDPTQSGANSLVGSTYLGGSNDDFARSIAVDPSGNVYITGRTHSFDFPVTGNAYLGTYNPGGDVFVAEMNFATQTLVYSTFFGGTAGLCEAEKILVDPSGKIAITGVTLDALFPVTQNAFQPAMGGLSNAFLTILDPTQQPGQQLVYSTYYGGNLIEAATGLRLDSSGTYYISGYTMSPNLPVTNGALSPVSAGSGLDGFVAVINPSLDPFHALVYGSYITGQGFQIAYDVDVDSAGVVYVTGMATDNIFPANQAQHATPGDPDVFLLIFTLP